MSFELLARRRPVTTMRLCSAARMCKRMEDRLDEGRQADEGSPFDGSRADLLHSGCTEWPRGRRGRVVRKTVLLRLKALCLPEKDGSSAPSDNHKLRAWRCVYGPHSLPVARL